VSGGYAKSPIRTNLRMAGFLVGERTTLLEPFTEMHYLSKQAENAFSPAKRDSCKPRILTLYNSTILKLVRMEEKMSGPRIPPVKHERKSVF
jgi:hypothetical protein